METVDEALPVEDTPAPAPDTPFYETLNRTGAPSPIDLIKEWRSFAADKLPPDMVELGVPMLANIQKSGPTYNVEVVRHSLHHLEWWLALYHSAGKTPTETTSKVFQG